MPQILARDIPEETLIALKERAKRHHRSLSKEVRAILVDAAAQRRESPMEAALRISKRLAERGIVASDSGELQAEDRER